MTEGQARASQAHRRLSAVDLRHAGGPVWAHMPSGASAIDDLVDVSRSQPVEASTDPVERASGKEHA